LDLEIEKSSYEFKNGEYVANAKSKTSIDTKFSIYYRSGKALRDDYEFYVLGMLNTLQRLEVEYSVVAKNIVEKDLGYKNNTTMVNFSKGEYENAKDNDILKLDMKFDKALPIKSDVTLRLDLADNSLEGITKILTDAHKVFVDNGCNFHKYGLHAQNGTMYYVDVNGVTTSDIESGELTNLLEKAKENKSGSGISVYIKGEKK